MMYQPRSVYLRSAFAYKGLAFAYVIIFTIDHFKPITCVRHNSDPAKGDFEYTYAYEKEAGLIALRTCEVHLTALFTQTDR